MPRLSWLWTSPRHFSVTHTWWGRTKIMRVAPATVSAKEGFATMLWGILKPGRYLRENTTRIGGKEELI